MWNILRTHSTAITWKSFLLKRSRRVKLSKKLVLDELTYAISTSLRGNTMFLDAVGLSELGLTYTIIFRSETFAFVPALKNLRPASGYGHETMVYRISCCQEMRSVDVSTWYDTLRAGITWSWVIVINQAHHIPTISTLLWNFRRPFNTDIFYGNIASTSTPDIIPSDSRSKICHREKGLRPSPNQVQIQILVYVPIVAPIPI